MTPCERRLQAALARLVGEVMTGGLVEPLRFDPRRNVAVRDAEALLGELEPPPSLYRYRVTWPRALLTPLPPARRSR